MTKTISLTTEQQEKAVALALTGCGYQYIADILSVSLIELWAYRTTHPSFQSSLDAARAESAHQIAENAEKVGKQTNLHPGVQRNQIEYAKWLASKRDTKVYGERMDINLTATLDIAGVLDGAERRVGPMLDLQSTQPIQVAEYTETKLDCATGSKPVNEPSEPEKELTFDDLG